MTDLLTEYRRRLAIEERWDAAFAIAGTVVAVVMLVLRVAL
jgi:hypothetical protein